MKVAMRTSFGIKLRSVETRVFDNTITKVVASPIASALIAELVTASTGHIPSTCTNTGFSRHRPLMNSSVDVIFSGLIATASRLLQHVQLRPDEGYPGRAALAQDLRNRLGRYGSAGDT